MKRRAARAISKIAKSAPKPRPDALIDPKVLQELVDVFHSAGVADLEVERGGLRVRLRRQEAVVAGQSREITVPVSEALRQSGPVETPASLAETEGLITVTSPIVGVLLCIVEAMKLMNEIESEVDGRVVKILVENTKPVEYGEALFLIEPGARPEA